MSSADIPFTSIAMKNSHVHPDGPGSAALARLDGALEHRLTLLIAPAGSDKTALLRRWVKARTWRVAWVTLDEGDNVLACFLDKLASAVRGLAPAIIPPSARSDLPEAAIVGWVNALADAPDDFVLVLDNYHVITAAAVHRSVELLLDYPPPRMHVVLAARSEPPLPLARLRARRQLLRVEVGGVFE